MKSALAAVVITISLLTSNLLYAVSNNSPQLKDYDKTIITKVPNYDDIYEIVLEELLTPEEMTYKSNIMLFMIDDDPYMCTFDLHVKLSNAGVEQKLVVYLKTGLLTRIAQSKSTEVKIGGNKDITINPEFKEKLIQMLFTTVS